MHLVPATGPRHSFAQIRQFIVELDRFRHEVDRSRSDIGLRFALAVSNLESALRGTFRDPLLWKELLSERYFQILRDPVMNSGFMAMLTSEVEFQVARLRQVLDEAESVQQSLAGADVVVVPDTNLLLHFKPLAELDWIKLLSVKAVRIFVPLKVIEELDALKYTKRQEIADRARQAIREIEAALGTDPSEIRSGVTIQSVALFDSNRSSPYADAAVLETCLDLVTLARQVRLATGDLGMRLRAERLGIKLLLLPEELRRSPPKAAGT